MAYAFQDPSAIIPTKTNNRCFTFVNDHHIHPCVAACYSFEEIGKAHRAMENSDLVGKAVVVFG